MDYQQLLIKPISDEQPSGCYLKDDRAKYRSLRNAFNTAQSSFRRLTETPDSSNDEELFEENQNNWQKLSEACWKTLTTESKDIEIYCWWVMSLSFQKNSMAKVAKSLANLLPFIKAFWPKTNPYLPKNKLKSNELDEQNKQRVEMQLKPLIQLLGESNNSGLLYMPLQILPLVDSIDHGQYLSASKTGKLNELKIQAMQVFSSQKNEITAQIKSFDCAIKAMSQLGDWLQKILYEFKLTIISTEFLKNNLNNCLQAMEFLVADQYDVWPLEPENVTDPVNKQSIVDEQKTLTETEALSVSNTQQGIQTMSMSNVNNRDQAFQELRKIADYFANAEPHSPVSFLLEKAIRWGYMSLPELMNELVLGNNKVLDQINLMTGIGEKKTTINISKCTTPMSDNNSTSENKSAINVEVSSSMQKVLVPKYVDKKQQKDDVSSSSSGSEFSW